MDEVSLNTEPTGDDDIDDFEVVGDYAMTEYVGQPGTIQNPLPPAVGMEFETYEDVYYFYNCYAKEQGFGVRVSNTWWRIIEVELEHNHLFSPASGKFYKSHKHIGPGTERTLQLDGADEVQKIRLFRTVVIDAEGNGNVDVNGEFGNNVDHANKLKLKPGDAQSVHNFFCGLQLMDPNFFNVADLNEKGCLRNLFWTDAR
ncbi:hypothetical protein Pint_04902 [Pistacia integerrima]|uniref:Uncharacterized protein n=1 Tax=Pistacia integerrima TaxID=434235 RepID=A0ACC0Z1M2_9ROSI|nr:hypothetical protein Pint_04902 [Pistacia integerrima]